MKTWKNVFFGLVAIIALGFVACGDGNTDNTLTGDVEITVDGDMEVGQTLTAVISNTNGTDQSKFEYQWTRGSVDIPGATGQTYDIVDALAKHSA